MVFLTERRGGVSGSLSPLVVSRVTDANLALWLEFAIQFKYKYKYNAIQWVIPDMQKS